MAVVEVRVSDFMRGQLAMEDMFEFSSVLTLLPKHDFSLEDMPRGGRSVTIGDCVLPMKYTYSRCTFDNIKSYDHVSGEVRSAAWTMKHLLAKMAFGRHTDEMWEDEGCEPKGVALTGLADWVSGDDVYGFSGESDVIDCGGGDVARGALGDADIVITGPQTLIAPVEAMKVVHPTWTVGEYSGRKYVNDINCPDGEMYAIKRDAFKVFVVAPPAWLEMDGSMLYRMPHNAKYEATIRAYLDIACMDRGANKKFVNFKGLV